jgi:hypothetical protein
MGVTVCGFCGAAMAGAAPALRPEDAEALWRGAAQATRVAHGARRWLLLGLGATAVGLAAGWLVLGAHGDSAAAPAVAAATAASKPPAAAGRGERSPAAAPPQPAVVRGETAVRLDEDRLHELADELAAAAASGDARRLVARVDARLRYKLRVDDAAGARELRGGKPELLAHWLAPWLVDELHGEFVDQTVEVERVAVDFDRRRGQIVRRIETAGDVSGIRFSRELLEPLALTGVVNRTAAARLELSPLRLPTSRCRGVETLRVAADPAGIKIVEAARVESCRPLD